MAENIIRICCACSHTHFWNTQTRRICKRPEELFNVIEERCPRAEENRFRINESLHHLFKPI